MPGNEIYDLVIIGGGPGGLTAGIYACHACRIKDGTYRAGRSRWPNEQFRFG
jgi:alkyl hydroperoxide reductase subunit AhpF